MAVEVFMPKMSDHMESGEIVEWLIGEGQRVEEGQPVVEIMTDKATASIEAPASGVLKGIRAGARKGVQVPVGETIAFIAREDENVPSLPPLEPAHGAAHGAGTLRPAEEPSSRAGSPSLPGRVMASPAARRRARELGTDLSAVRGSGPGGLVRESDVAAYHGRTKKQAAGSGTEEWIDLTPMQRVTGERMALSAATVPQFSLSVDADVEKLLSIRETLMERVEAETGRRLSFTTLLVAIVAAALRRYPRANASFEQGRIRLFGDVNVGVAMGTERGLVVPVIAMADRKTVVQINREMEGFEEKARAMRFEGSDLQGGHFTISNLGMYGIDRFTALINPPQSSILSVGRIVNRPVGTADNTVALRKLVNLTLSVDHRCMDGIQGAEFLRLIQQLTEKPDIFAHGGENET